MRRRVLVLGSSYIGKIFKYEVVAACHKEYSVKKEWNVGFML